MRARSLIPMVFALLLSGCNGVPLMTQWKLRHFELGAADISKLRVALRGPEWATPTPERAVLEVIRAGEDGERKLIIHLRRAQHFGDAVELARLARDATPLSVYEVAPQDLATVAGLQAEAAKAKPEGRAGVGSIKIGSGVACRNGPVPGGPISIDAYLHPDDEIGWLPLVEGFDLRPGIKSDEDRRAFDDSVPPCGKPASRSKPQATR
jgi:hypothetical protein